MKDEILDYGTYVFGNEKSFFDWLFIPNKKLDATPYELLNTEESYKVMDLLCKYEHGIYQ